MIDPKYHHLTNDLHIGVHRDNVSRARDIGTMLSGSLGTYADGDGWNVWGELPGEEGDWDGRGDNNDPDTMHVIIRFPRSTRVEAHVNDAVRVLRESGVLVPFAPCDYQGGEVAVLTDTVDWSMWNDGKVHVWH